MPSSLALARVAAHAEAFIPWASAVNARASLAGAIVATLLAIHAGSTAVLYAAVAFYALALAVLPREASAPGTPRGEAPLLPYAASGSATLDTSSYAGSVRKSMNSPLATTRCTAGSR